MPRTGPAAYDADMPLTLTDLNVYPVKSTRGTAVPQAEVAPWGLVGDRRWAVVGDDGDPLTAREHPVMFRIHGLVQADGLGITLTAPDREPLHVPAPDPATAPVITMDGLGPALLAETETEIEIKTGPGAAAAWLTEVIGTGARLVWQCDPRQRPVPAEHGGLPGDHQSFADDGPLLLASSASMRRLNDWIVEGALERGEPAAPEPLPISRFRPNAVIDGELPFAEDDWRRVRIGEVEFRVSESCDRCVMTTIDAATLAKGREPIRTLAAHRRRAGKVWFGVRLIPLGLGTIRVGDAVTPLH
jgi:hypothetical protein